MKSILGNMKMSQLSERRTFVVSDLHMGIGDARDNFAAMAGGIREQEFLSFLDMVEGEKGILIILGDLFELWQNNISAVLNYRKPLLDRLAAMNAVYILGNHDIDLKYLNQHESLSFSHPLFKFVRCSEIMLKVGEKNILLIHGHEQDKYCRDEKPGIGRISAIYSGLKEDRNDSPLSKSKFRSGTIESQALGKFTRFSNFARGLVGMRTNEQQLHDEVIKTWRNSRMDALIFGHTHSGGSVYSKKEGPLPIYNTGTWAEEINTYARIETNGSIELFNWAGNELSHNNTLLKV